MSEMAERVHGSGFRPKVAPSRRDESYESWTITPDDAVVLLEGAYPNRKENRHKSGAMVRDLHSGHWVDQASELIVHFVNGEYRLGDGSHRLTSQVRANATATYRVRIVTSNDRWEELFPHIDEVAPRTAEDAITMDPQQGIDRKNMRSVARAQYWIRRLISENPSKSFLYKPTTREAVIMSRMHPEVYDYATIAGRTKGFIQESLAVAMLFLVTEELRPKLMKFLDCVATGLYDPAEPGHVAIVSYRNMITADAKAKKKLPPYLRGALAVKTWNLFATRRPVSRVFIRGNFEFPDMYGINKSAVDWS